MAEIKVGSKAPAFSLKDKDDITHSLKDINTKYTIIYFYPKDNTPGCTVEAKLFSKEVSNFKRLKTTIIGISGGDEKSKTKFCEKYNLKITLLSDPEFAIAKKYGVYGKKSFMGRTFMGIFRQTFVLDKNYKLIKHYDKINPATHAEEVKSFIKSLS